MKVALSTGTVMINRKNLGITNEPITGLPRYNPYSQNLQRRETGDSIGLFARDFGLLIPKKSSKLFMLLTAYHYLNIR